MKTATDRRRILVTGGTGNLGRRVVAELKRANLLVRILTRSVPSTASSDLEWAQGDYLSGQGIAPALDRVDAVLHTAHDPRRPGRDLTGVERLLSYSLAAGVQHFTQVGIIGAARVPGFGYYAAKSRAEVLVAQSGLPFSVFRSSQFHPFVASWLLNLERLPVAFVPAGSLQPADIDEVAAALARHVVLGEAGTEEFAGPEVRSIADLTRLHLAAQHSGKRVVPLRLPLPALRAIESGVLTSKRAARGKRTFEQWLSGRALDQPDG